MNIERDHQPDQIEELNQRALSWPEKADSVVIDSQKSYESAALFELGIVTLEKEGEAEYGPIKEDTNRAHKTACKNYNNFMTPLKAAKRTLGRKRGDYERDEEMKRQAEQRRLDAIARKADEDARLATAVALEDAGESEAAERVIEARPTPAPIVSLPPAVQKVEGLRSTRTTWHAEVFDLDALIQFRKDNPALAHYTIPEAANMKELNAAAVRQKGTLNIPGVRAVSVRS